MKKHVLVLLIGILSLTKLNAQNSSIGPSVLNASGGSAVLNNNVYEWSIGEMTLVQTFSDPSVVLTQGVLQPWDISVGVKDLAVSGTGVIVYPNPARDYLLLQSDLPSSGDLRYVFYDLSGRAILENQVYLAGGTETVTLNLSGLPAGFYFINVSIKQGQDTFQKTYPLQKIN